MITITAEKIATLLRDVSPVLIDWNPTDEEYAMVADDEVQRLVDEFPALPWKPGVYECEEIAKAFVMDVRRWEAKTDQSMNRAIGVAYCSRVNGDEMSHTVNVLIVDGNVTLIDMQTGEYWPAERGNDELYFVEM